MTSTRNILEKVGQVTRSLDGVIDAPTRNLFNRILAILAGSTYVLFFGLKYFNYLPDIQLISIFSFCITTLIYTVRVGLSIRRSFHDPFYEALDDLKVLADNYLLMKQALESISLTDLKHFIWFLESQIEARTRMVDMLTGGLARLGATPSALLAAISMIVAHERIDQLPDIIPFVVGTFSLSIMFVCVQATYVNNRLLGRLNWIKRIASERDPE